MDFEKLHDKFGLDSLIEEKCCFCGKQIWTFTNSPVHAMELKEDGTKVKMDYSDDDVCCDECYLKYVVPGRK